MEKKLTKKELKEIEERQEELRKARRDVIDAFKSYDKDVEATKRFYRINEQFDKLEYGGSLKVEEVEKILRRYECLNFLKPYDRYTKEERDNFESRAWDFVRMMYWTKIEDDSWGDDKKLEGRMMPDSIWNEEIIWSKEHLAVYLRLAKKFGYTKLYYTNSSSGALENITDLVNYGAKVIGTCKKAKYDKGGLIFDISEVKLEGEE